MNQKQMILVGYSRAAEEYIDRIQQNPQWGYVVSGILDDNVPAGTVYNGIKVIGRIANLNVILPANRLDEIAITLGLSEYYRLEEIVAMCEKSGVHTKFIPDYNKIIPTKPYTEDILGLPVINIRYVPLSNTFNAMVKRVMDIVGSIMANHSFITGHAADVHTHQADITGTSDLQDRREWDFITRLSGCTNSVLWKFSRKQRKRRHGQ